ncbi:cytochrome P450 [Streptomyces aidingensis]|uniref:Cytochrome P450 n=1 Tax=Streptomyces aidingensis TaxID=910347 RepID=A0A1I1IWH5_9ACTN|nr:cytochrome P450 [Streptomyces aidingensis]SFC40647.1 Cytochrome P450 [Streptomyces aidingensis]
MTDPHSTLADGAFPEPPPGCPAHAAHDGRRPLFGPQYENDPMSWYSELRARHGAVAPVLLPGELPAWLVLGYRENVEVARNHYLFSRDSRNWREIQDGRITPDHPMAPITAWQPLCNLVDGKEHKRLRGSLADSLSRFHHRGLRRYITQSAHALIDEFCEHGRAELVGLFSEHLPMLVLAKMMDLPEDQAPRLGVAVWDLLKGSPTAPASNDFVTELLSEVIARKSREPGHDLASVMFRHEAGLDADSVREHLRLVLVSAASTSCLLSDAVRVLLSDERFRANLRGGHMRLPDAIEQVLWDYPPFVTVVGRWATTDTMLADQQIRKGDMLILGLAAANTDPAVRPDLRALVIGNRSHLSFGAGDHICPGSHIARAIASVGIGTLLTRLPDLELAASDGELEWQTSLLLRTLTRLPVQFTPRPRVGRAWEADTRQVPAAAEPAAL